MAVETELKLRMLPDDLAKLRRHPLFKLHQVTTPETRRLHNVYYDTPTLDLHKHRMALRVRRVGGRWIQTLKGGGQVRAGLHQRFEWETPVPSARLDFTGLDRVVWDEHLPVAWREHLLPVFTTDFYRASRLIDWQGTIIEVCMDKGSVRTQQHSAPICELELELKSGDPQQLFSLAQAILDIVPFELETVSKAELGFRLIAGFVPQPVKSELPDLSAAENVTSALQKIIWSCLQHWQGNLRGALGYDHDAEYLHQMRVALRRLRIVLRMAEKISADEELSALRAALAQLSGVLGRMREWDVLIRDLNKLPDVPAGFELLISQCEQQRTEAYAVLRAQAEKMQRLLLRFAVWMNGSYWPQAEQGAPELAKFARRCLRQLAKRYQKAAESSGMRDDEALHELRLEAKKLRYSAECFAGLFSRSKAGAYIADLSEVQELLGEINDAMVAQRLLAQLAYRIPAETAAWVVREINGKLSKNIKMLHKDVKVFDNKNFFWE
ncbi:MAG: CHAD domain-containing protein [Nitrosomonadales bacterium]